MLRALTLYLLTLAWWEVPAASVSSTDFSSHETHPVARSPLFFCLIPPKIPGLLLPSNHELGTRI